MIRAYFTGGSAVGAIVILLTAMYVYHLQSDQAREGCWGRGRRGKAKHGYRRGAALRLPEKVQELRDSLVMDK